MVTVYNVNQIMMLPLMSYGEELWSPERKEEEALINKLYGGFGGRGNMENISGR